MKQRGKRILYTLTAFMLAGAAVAADGDAAGGIKEMRGISIKADKEAPRSLYIVPWHDAEHKQNTSLSSGLIDDSLRVIDQKELKRQLRLHELSASGWHSLAPNAR